MLPMVGVWCAWQDYKTSAARHRAGDPCKVSLNLEKHTVCACGGTKSRFFFQAVFRGCRMILLVVYCKETGGHFSDIRWQSEEVVIGVKRTSRLRPPTSESDPSGHCTFLPDTTGHCAIQTARAKQVVVIDFAGSPKIQQEELRHKRWFVPISASRALLGAWNAVARLRSWIVASSAKGARYLQHCFTPTRLNEWNRSAGPLCCRSF